MKADVNKKEILLKIKLITEFFDKYPIVIPINLNVIEVSTFLLYILTISLGIFQMAYVLLKRSKSLNRSYM